MPAPFEYVTPGEPTAPTYGDYARAAVPIGGAAVVSALPALGRYGASFSDDPRAKALQLQSQYLQNAIGHFAEGQVEALSPVAQKRLSATLGSKEFWEAPLSSLGLKTAANVAPLLAMVGPTLLTGGGAGGLAALAVSGSALGTGETLDQIYQEGDRQSDKELTDSVPYYRQQRAAGMSETDARNSLNKLKIGLKPFMLLPLEAITNVLGPPGQIAGALGKATARKAASGILKGVGREAGVGGGSEFVESSAEAFTAEQANVDAGIKPAVDVGSVFEQGAEGAALGVILGGPTGVVGAYPRATAPGRANPAVASTAPALPVNPVAPPSTLSAGSVTPPTGSTARVKPANQKKPAGQQTAAQPTTTQPVVVAAGQPAPATTTAAPAPSPAPLKPGAAVAPPVPKPASKVRKKDLVWGAIADGDGAQQSKLGDLNLAVMPAPEGEKGFWWHVEDGTTILRNGTAPTLDGAKGMALNAAKVHAVPATGQNAPSTPTSGPPSVKRGGSLGVIPKVAPADTTTAGTRPAGTQQARKPAIDLAFPGSGSGVTADTPASSVGYGAPLHPMAAGMSGTPVITPTVKSPSPEQAAALATKRAEQAPTPAPPSGAQASTPAPVPAAPLAGAGTPAAQPVPVTAAPTPAPAPVGAPAAVQPAAPVATPLVPGATETLTSVVPAPATPVVAQPRPRVAGRLTAALGTKPRTVAPQAMGQVSAEGTETTAAPARSVAVQKISRARPKPAPAPAPVVAPVVEPAPAPNILPDTTEEADTTRQRTLAVHKEEVLLEKQRLKSEQQAGKSHKGKDEQAKKAADEEASTKLHTDNVPDEITPANTKQARTVLRARADHIISEAEKAGIEIPKTVNDKTHGPLAWLREVANLKKTLDKPTREAPNALTHINEFLSREITTKDGDFSLMKSSRKAEGEQKARVQQRDVEGIAGGLSTTDVAAAETAAEADAAVQEEGELSTTGRTSAKGAPRGLGAASEPEKGKQRAGEGRTVELTPELKAEYAAKAAALKKETPEEALARLAAKEAEGEARVGGVKTETKAEKEARKAEQEAEAEEAAKETAVEKKVTLKGKAKAEEIKAKAPDKGKAKVDEVKAKRAASKAKLKEETDKVARDRTEAQEAADNYKQGHVPLDGNRVTIKTPKGDTLTETQPDGRRTVTTMKHHVGILNGTETADGKPLTVVLGPKATPGNPDLHDAQVFVVDENDPATGTHVRSKVMLGFNDAKQALDAWLGTTHDGDSKRFGDVTPMTADQFKAWRKSKEATAPAGTGSESIGIETEPVSIRDAMELGRLAQTNPIAFFARRGIEPKSFGAIRKQLFGRPNPVLEKLLERLGKYIDDVRVFSVDDETFAALQRGRRRIAAYYDPDNHIIVVNENEMARARQSFGGLDSRARFMAHEGVHAAFLQALTARPELRAAIDQIALELREQLITLGEPFTQYAYLNADEFLAEALSNKTMQDWLANTKASHSLKRTIADRRLSLQGRSIRSLWDALRDVVAKTLGLTTNAEHTLLDAIMQVGSELEYHLYTGAKPTAMATDEIAARTQAILSQGAPWRREASGTTFAKFPRWRFEQPGLSLDDIPFSPFNRKPVGPQIRPPRALWFSGMDHMAQTAKDFGKDFYHAVRKVVDRVEMRRVTAERLFRGSEPLIRRSLALQKSESKENWSEFASIAHDSTTARADPTLSAAAQKHLGINSLTGMADRADHADLVRRWNDLMGKVKDPAGIKSLYQDAIAHHAAQQDAMNLAVITNKLWVLGIPEGDRAALAQRMHEAVGKSDDELDPVQTDADRDLLGKDVYDSIVNNPMFQKVKGPYFPKMRRGDFAVKARFEVPPPHQATTGEAELLPDSDNTWEFKGPNARKQAQDYIQSKALLGVKREMTSVWVDSQNPDSKTNRFFLDPATGKEVKVTPQDMDAEQRFRVHVQDQFLSYEPTERAARELAHELSQDQNFSDIDAQPRKLELRDSSDGMLKDSARLRTLAGTMKNHKNFQSMAASQQAEVIQTLNQVAIRYLSATSVQSRRLPRRHVLGESEDLSQNMLDYNTSTSGYLAGMEHAPALNDALTDMNNLAFNDKTNYDKSPSMGRGKIANEIEGRLYTANPFEERGGWHDWSHRAATLASLNFLGSPAHTVIQLLQTGMVSYPVLASHLGPGRAGALLYKAYKEIGTAKTLMAGFKEMAAQAMHAGKPPASFTEDIISSIKDPNKRKMLNYLADRGSLGLDSGLELSRILSAMTGYTGKMDLSLAYMSAIARVMPRAAETINRTATAIAAYEGELAKNNGDHDAATIYAQETVNLTHGIYSHTDAPKVFNHPIGRLTFQFKRFGQLMYKLLGHQIGRIIRNANPGDRAEGIKALSMLAVTHVAMAGALGLPTEPAKWLVMGANVMLGTGLKWEDVEAYFRSAAAEAIGPQAAELLMRGLPRAVGLDLSSRVGMSDLLTPMHEPADSSPSEIMGYFGELFGGATLGMAGQIAQGAAKGLHGDVIGALESGIPIKGIRDIIKDYRISTEGKLTPSGMQSLEAYDPLESFIQALGFTPGRAAETGEARQSLKRATAKVSARRIDFERRWKDASPGERLTLWGEIEQYNRGATPEERITRTQLETYKKRSITQEQKHGFIVNKRNRGSMMQMEGTYNLQ